ncbi:MAG TPA: hypothetical protein VK438_13635 [Xanthobacteraceae bacterium]|nr:hypothetical protein [Xanthobacteraceae bacterium]
MSTNDEADTPCSAELFDARVARIGLRPDRLKPEQLEKFRAIQRNCPACRDPARCAAGLVFTAPKEELEDWDDYCPNAAKLRILAALTMFQPETE